MESETGMTYNANSFGQYLKKYADRVFDLEDGISVRVVQLPRKKNGFPWRLEAITTVKGNTDVP
jgi:hypothetical protein